MWYLKNLAADAVFVMIAYDPGLCQGFSSCPCCGCRRATFLMPKRWQTILRLQSLALHLGAGINQLCNLTCSGEQETIYRTLKNQIKAPLADDSRSFDPFWRPIASSNPFDVSFGLQLHVALPFVAFIWIQLPLNWWSLWCV